MRDGRDMNLARSRCSPRLTTLNVDDISSFARTRSRARSPCSHGQWGKDGRRYVTIAAQPHFQTPHVHAPHSPLAKRRRKGVIIEGSVLII